MKTRGQRYFVGLPMLCCFFFAWMISGCGPPLTVLVKQRQHDKVKSWLSIGTNVNVHDPESQKTTLCIAAENNDLPMMKLLLDHGYKIDIFNPSGYTAFSCAVHSGNLEAVNFLIDNGADVNKGLRPPIASAIESNNTQMIETLLQNGAKVENYEAFLKRYPPLKLSPEKKQAIAAFFFGLAKKKNTIQSYKRFLENYGTSIYADEARSILEKIYKAEISVIEQKRFDEVMKANTAAGYEKFRRDYRDGPFFSRVTALYKNALAKEVHSGVHGHLDLSYTDVLDFTLTGGKLAALAKYLKNFPEDQQCGELIASVKKQKRGLVDQKEKLIVSVTHAHQSTEAYLPTGKFLVEPNLRPELELRSALPGWRYIELLVNIRSYKENPAEIRPGAFKLKDNKGNMSKPDHYCWRDFPEPPTPISSFKFKKSGPLIFYLVYSMPDGKLDQFVLNIRGKDYPLKSFLIKAGAIGAKLKGF